MSFQFIQYVAEWRVIFSIVFEMDTTGVITCPGPNVLWLCNISALVPNPCRSLHPSQAILCNSPAMPLLAFPNPAF